MVRSSTDSADVHRHRYPRPQLVRGNWTNLNGQWDFALDPEAKWRTPDQVEWQENILVPFAPETPASGIGFTDHFSACWYQRNFRTPKLPESHRLLLHFGAVDWEADVWVNGRHAVHHEGGYTPFSADITDLLIGGDEQTVTVRAFDDPMDLAKPRGKQDWASRPHFIWYWRTSGIWQTVWLEQVPATWISSLRWASNLERWEISLAAETAGLRQHGMQLNVKLRHRHGIIVDDTYSLSHAQVARRICLPDPGVDNYREHLLWSPSHPNLIRAELSLIDAGGALIDRVHSYTAMRRIHLQGDRFVLNNRPIQLRLVLDQGYWKETGLTAPDDESLRRDVELVKAMGFHGVRKHQKIEDPRYLYWADVLGLLVWEELPSAYSFGEQSIRRLTDTWTAAIQRDISHPCIIAWVPFNESWGTPDLPTVPAQRHLIRSMYHLTKSLDPTRPVVGNDGWESIATDIIAVHDYDADPARLAYRYGGDPQSMATLKRERPGGRILLLEEHAADLPIMLTEFGGIACAPEGGAWGYSRVFSSDDFAARYAELLGTVRSLPMLAGFCYTQLTDVYQEANGLLTMDRQPKFPVEQIAVATRGAETAMERKIEARWEQRWMTLQRQQAMPPAGPNPQEDSARSP